MLLVLIAAWCKYQVCLVLLDSLELWVVISSWIMVAHHDHSCIRPSHFILCHRYDWLHIDVTLNSEYGEDLIVQQLDLLNEQICFLLKVFDPWDLHQVHLSRFHLVDHLLIFSLVFLDWVFDFGMHLFHIFELLGYRLTNFCPERGMSLLHKSFNGQWTFTLQMLYSLDVHTKFFNMVEALQDFIGKIWIQVVHSDRKSLFRGVTRTTRRTH